MKNKILSIISVIAFLMGISACHSPEEFNPTVERNIINNLTASFPDDDSDDNSFTSEIDYTNHVITVVFPYNYPKLSDNVLQLSDLKKMRVIADLDNNVYVYPTLLFMDMTKDNFITVKDQTGASTEYKVVAEIRKSNECAITKFKITSLGLSGIINESTKTISLISLESIGEVLADISISHGATISPDPRTVALNYDQDQKITVTAQNGTTKSTYTVKKEIPEKIAAGLRANSAKLIWAKKLTDRKELLKVAKLGPKAFEQCAGFMRISGGKNPLDATSVHPESYEAAAALLKKLGYKPNDVVAGNLLGLSLQVRDYNKMFENYTLGFPNREVEQGFFKFLLPNYASVKKKKKA